MNKYTIKKGFDIKLAGRPKCEIEDFTQTEFVSVYPLEFRGIKQKLKVEEGSLVKRGSILLSDKKNESFSLCAPAGGKVTKIIRGNRRFVETIIISISENEESEIFKKYTNNEIANTAKDEILNLLLRTGYISYLQERPFGNIANIANTPKSIFVNAMNTGDFQADANLVVENDSDAFQMGIEILNKLTTGNVNLCVANNANNLLKSTENVNCYEFEGPHPSGNTSVHISKIDPMKPTDIIWTIKAVDLVQVGRLFLDGKLPTTRIISLGGNGVKETGQKHFKVRVGTDLTQLLNKYIAKDADAGELVDDLMLCNKKVTDFRVINGDVLSGKQIKDTDSLRFLQSSITVIPEGKERKMFGWMMPGMSAYTFSRTYLSSYLNRIFKKTNWKLNSNLNGGKRALVLTEEYDKVMPMNIMVDFLIRAVLAGDTDEAIKLGILETLPEDFALCDFICPSKMEVQNIIFQGLKEIEEEGI